MSVVNKIGVLDDEVNNEKKASDRNQGKRIFLI